MLYRRPEKDLSTAPFPEVRWNLRWWDPLSWLSVGRKLRKTDLVVFPWTVPFHAPHYLAIMAIAKKKPVAIMAHSALPHEPFPAAQFLARQVLKRAIRLVAHAEEVERRPAPEAPVRAALGVGRVEAPHHVGRRGLAAVHERVDREHALEVLAERGARRRAEEVVEGRVVEGLAAAVEAAREERVAPVVEHVRDAAVVAVRVLEHVDDARRVARVRRAPRLELELALEPLRLEAVVVVALDHVERVLAERRDAGLAVRQVEGQQALRCFFP